MDALYKGSCQCQKVKYEIVGEFESFYLCHCQYCQKDTGSAHAANLFSSTAKLVWLAGEKNIKTFNIPKTRHSKSFCTDCGSAVAMMQNESKLLVAPAGGLDTEVLIKPTAHLFISKRANWDKDLEKRPKFSELPHK